MDTNLRSTFSGPIGLAIAGVILLIVKAVLDSFSYLPALADLLGTLGGFAIAAAVVWAIIALVLRVLGRSV